MNLKSLFFVFIFFVFDLILSRSEDSVHSEYVDIICHLHILLTKTILINAVVKLYAAKLKQFFFSLNYVRLQFSIHHLKSYSLFDHVK